MLTFHQISRKVYLIENIVSNALRLFQSEESAHKKLFSFSVCFRTLSTFAAVLMPRHDGKSIVIFSMENTQEKAISEHKKILAAGKTHFSHFNKN